jgi:hypothetical protein
MKWFSTVEGVHLRSGITIAAIQKMGEQFEHGDSRGVS